MASENGFTIVDDALQKATETLQDYGMPKDDAHIALLIRLWNVVPKEVVKVAELLNEDNEIFSRINKDDLADERLTG